MNYGNRDGHLFLRAQAHGCLCHVFRQMKEIEYLDQLKQQRHMYEWCLKHIGRYPENKATEEAERVYAYKPSSDEYRGLVFHDDAWHWAMLKLKGEQYWLNCPECKSPSPEYEQEWGRYERSHG